MKPRLFIFLWASVVALVFVVMAMIWSRTPDPVEAAMPWPNTDLGPDEFETRAFDSGSLPLYETGDFFVGTSDNTLVLYEWSPVFLSRVVQENPNLDYAIILTGSYVTQYWDVFSWFEISLASNVIDYSAQTVVLRPWTGVVSAPTNLPQRDSFPQGQLIFNLFEKSVTDAGMNLKSNNPSYVFPSQPSLFTTPNVSGTPPEDLSTNLLSFSTYFYIESTLSHRKHIANYYVAYCGDGVVDSWALYQIPNSSDTLDFNGPLPQEQCDDGNRADGDGCSATCETESLTCAQISGSVTPTTMGTGGTEYRVVIEFSGDALPNPSSDVVITGLERLGQSHFAGSHVLTGNGWSPFDQTYSNLSIGDAVFTGTFSHDGNTISCPIQPSIEIVECLVDDDCSGSESCQSNVCVDELSCADVAFEVQPSTATGRVSWANFTIDVSSSKNWLGLSWYSWSWQAMNVDVDLDSIDFSTSAVVAQTGFFVFTGDFWDRGSQTEFSCSTGFMVESDLDLDGVLDDDDNCPSVLNADQVDFDDDWQGAACDDDDDDDGVDDDTDDKCPNTPSGVDVNLDGCPDSDGDGIRDSDDNCPTTQNPQQEDQDNDGTGDVCDNDDDDGDGVPDGDDACPNTPSGEAVDVDGCSDSQRDTDGDGVTDDVDECPNTPSGETVDGNGCSDSQLDTDGDGVNDDVDQCSNTPSGEAVDVDGCSDSQRDTDGDGVTDDVDECPNGATNWSSNGSTDRNGDGCRDDTEDPDGYCGDGDTQSAREECDDWPNWSSNCSPSCQEISQVAQQVVRRRGNGNIVIEMDQCPGGDFSPSYYDGVCDGDLQQVSSNESHNIVSNQMGESQSMVRLIGQACVYDQNSYLTEPFADTLNHRAFWPYIETLRINCVHRGRQTSAGVFYFPNEPIRRGEVVKTVALLVGLRDRDFQPAPEFVPITQDLAFADVQRDFWEAQYVRYLQQKNLLGAITEQQGNQRFLDLRSRMTRKDALVLSMQAYEKIFGIDRATAARLPNPFVDLPANDPNKELILFAHSIGAIDGRGTAAGARYLDGDLPISRAEFAKFVSEIFAPLLTVDVEKSVVISPIFKMILEKLQTVSGSQERFIEVLMVALGQVDARQFERTFKIDRDVFVETLSEILFEMFEE